MTQTSLIRPPRRLLYARDLLRALVAREIKAGYKDSILGLAWTVLTPLLYLLIFHLIFQGIFASGVKRYSSFAFIGMTVFTWFQTSLIQAVKVIRDNRSLVLQPGFPTSILPAVSVAAALVNFAITLPVLMLVLTLEHTVPGWTILWFPFLILVQFAFTLGIAYLVAALNVPFRDTQYLLIVLLQLYFFATPIFYDISKIPPGLKWIFVLNPMVYIIQSYRNILMHNQIPPLLPLFIIGVVSLGLLNLSYRMFVRASHRFVEEL